MPKLRTILVLCGTLCAGGSADAADDLLHSTFAQMDQAAAAFRGMTADVTQVSHTAVLPDDDETNLGTLAVRRANPHLMQLLMHFRQPDEKLVHFSGRMAEVYLPRSNSEQIYDLGKKNVLLQQFLLIGLGSSSRDLQSGYAVKLGGEEAVNGQKAVRLDLAPKSPDVAKLFTRIEIWIAAGGPAAGVAVRQKLYEKGGDYILATYSNIRLDPNLPESAVKLTVPKDAAKTYPQLH